MKKTVLMSAARKARIALAVMAVFGMSFVGTQEAFAENVTVDIHKNIICGDGAKAEGYYVPINAIAIGTSAIVEDFHGIAIGHASKVIGYHSIAFGDSAETGNYESIAIGLSSKNSGYASISVGAYSKASGEKSVALGAHSVADEENTVSVGGMYKAYVGVDTVTGATIYEDKLLTRKIVNVAEGKKDTDAATVGQIITNIQKSSDGSKLEFYTGKGTDGNGTKKWEFDLAAGGSTLTQTDFDNMLNSSTKFNDLQTAVGNKANANGDNIKTDAGSKWAEKLGNGAIENGNNNLVNGGTVYNKIGDLNSLTTTEQGNLVGAVNEVNKKANDAQTTANSALNKANANETKIGDTSKLNGLGSNLSDAVVKVDDKTKQNAKDIKNVNGRVDELGGRVDTLGGAVAKLDSRVNKVGAGAAALAALHPMEFDSDNKLSFAAGVGNYRGTNAAAIGAFYRPSEQVMFSISGNMGNGENMVNAGVSFALDRPSKTPTTKAALVKTVVAQNEQIAALNETVAEQSREIAELKAMVQQLAAKQNA